MTLEEKDLKAIKQIIKEEIGGVEDRLNKKIGGVEGRINNKIGGVEDCLNSKIGEVEDRLNQKIGGAEDCLNQKIDTVKDEIITVINQEITDQAEINRALMKSFDAKDSELDRRVSRIERHLGLVSPRSK